jgi:hypothetical protein
LSRKAARLWDAWEQNRLQGEEAEQVRKVRRGGIPEEGTLDRKLKVHFSKSLNLPVLLHGVPAWGCGATSNMKQLKVIQNKILRSVCDGDRYT